MNAPPSHPLLALRPAPEVVDPELAPLLSEPFAAAWAEPEINGRAAAALRERLQSRVAAARQAEAGMVTVRRRSAARRMPAPGVSVQPLYGAARPDALRPGEPLRTTLVELAPGACFQANGRDLDGTALHREWLLVAGSACLRGQVLSERDYHAVPAGTPPAPWASATGALLFLRESRLGPAAAGQQAFTVLDAEAGWQDFGPGIRRRVLWQHGGQAALLYAAEAGAQVPAHSHGHDEECLMVQGELFLDDRLLQAGDYQLARAGTGHRITETDTGVVIYAHGDLDLQFTL